MTDTPPKGVFDRFAETVAGHASRAWFFTACMILVLVWAPSYFLFGSVDTWQLVINTATTIVTFLMVALLQNSSRRDALAMHAKLDAVAQGLRDLMEFVGGTDQDFGSDIAHLERTIGLEHDLGTKGGSGVGG